MLMIFVFLLYQEIFPNKSRVTTSIMTFQPFCCYPQVTMLPALACPPPHLSQIQILLPTAQAPHPLLQKMMKEAQALKVVPLPCVFTHVTLLYVNHVRLMFFLG